MGEDDDYTTADYWADVADDEGPGTEREKAAKEDPKADDLVSLIMAYEQGDLDEDDIVYLFQSLYDTGTINHLQGSYQRAMRSLIDGGYINTEPKR